MSAIKKFYNSQVSQSDPFQDVAYLTNSLAGVILKVVLVFFSVTVELSLLLYCKSIHHSLCGTFEVDSASGVPKMIFGSGYTPVPASL